MDLWVPNFLRHLTLLVVTVHLISCQQKSIIDKDNNIVLMPRDDINISLKIAGFDNNTFNNIAHLLSDNVFNATEAAEDATDVTTAAEDEDDNVWDSDMFTESDSADNSTSELEDIFNHRSENQDEDFMSEDFGGSDSGVTTPSTTTVRMTYIQKVPRRQKPYPSARRRRHASQQLDNQENIENERNHFLWVRAAPQTPVSQIENSTKNLTREDEILNQLSSNNINKTATDSTTFMLPIGNSTQEIENITSSINNSKTNKSASDSSKSPGSARASPSKSAKSELGWVSQVLTEVMAEFSPVLSNDSLCRTHSQMYLTHLRNLTLWAMKMMDSSAVTPSGLLAANMHQLGNFDECVSISLPEHQMRGQYCLASATFAPTRDAYAEFHDGDHSRDFERPDEFDFVWDTVKHNLDPARIPRNKFYWALCVPSSCSARDLQVSLTRALDGLRDKHLIQFNVTVPERSCYTRDSQEEYPAGFWIFVSVSLFLVSLVSMATFYDLVVFRRNTDDSNRRQIIKKWLIPFSGLSNMEKLGSPNDQAEFSIIHALKAITMCQIIVGHRNMNTFGNVMFNPEFTEEKSSQLAWSYFNNGTLVVDTFFLIGGFLTFYFIFHELDKRKGRINYLVVFLYRFIRVTPVYAFVIFFYIYILPHLNDGPLWRDIIGRESSRCAQNWWTNLLYINNYYHEDQMCMVQSWYLSCDFHFFIGGTLLTYVIWRWQRWAKVTLASCLLVFVVLPFSFVYQNGYWGHYRTYISQMMDPPTHPEFHTLYIKSHFRAIPYIIGMAVAYTYIKLKEKKYKFSTFAMWAISLGAFCLGHTPYLLAGLAYVPGRPYYRLEQALFNPLQRLVWSVCIGWIIVGHGTTGFGPISRIFGHRVFVPFSRLTFCAYLIHVGVQLTSIATMRTPTYVSYTGLTLAVFGDLMFTFFCAFLFNIMIESPLDRFQKKVIKSLIGGLSPGPAADNKVKEEIINSAFQQGLGKSNIPPPHQQFTGKPSQQDFTNSPPYQEFTGKSFSHQAITIDRDSVAVKPSAMNQCN